MSFQGQVQCIEVYKVLWNALKKSHVLHVLLDDFKTFVLSSENRKRFTEAKMLKRFFV